MKTLIWNKYFACSLLCWVCVFGSTLAFAAQQQPQSQQSSDLKDEFNTLGDNGEVADRVKNMDSRQKIRVVQNRVVSLNNRLEVDGIYSYVGGADTYVQTQNLGLSLQYHLNSRFAFGIEYDKAYNALTAEGQRVYNTQQAAQSADPYNTGRFAAVDYPLSTTLATVTFAPIYGKLNFFDSSVVQFDVYGLLGYGKKSLNSGDSDDYAGGIGTSVWLNSWFTTKLEVRYEKYTDLLQTENRSQSSVDARLSIGFMVW